MLLEVAAEERLVGEAVSVGYFLQRQFGRLQGYFQFQNQVPVNDGLGCLSSYLPGNGGKVAGRYTKLLGIECHVVLRTAIRMYEVHELLEQLIFTVAPFYLLACEEALHLVVSIKEEYLQQILGNGFPEAVLPVLVDGGTGCCQSGNSIVSVNAGMCVAGIFFQKVDKGWWQPEAGILKHIEAAAEVVQAKVIAGFFYKEYAAGYQDNACIFGYMVMI